MKPSRSRPLLFAVAIATLVSGCALGPKAIEKTHGRYQESIRQVEAEQFLRNIVHLRYSEPPMELAVSSIASQYELAGSAEVRPFFLAPNPSNSIFRTFTSILPDLSVSGANRPTITFIPSNDGDSARRFLTPISPDTLAFLVETSWPVSVIQRLWVERLNGVPNAVTASGPNRGIISDHARFLRVVDLLQTCQDREWLTLRVESRPTEVGGPLAGPMITAAAMVDAAKNEMEFRPRDDGQSWSLMRAQNKQVIRVNPTALDQPELQEIVRLLNIRPNQLTYDVVVAPGIIPDPLRHPRPPSPDVRIMPRSTAQVYFYLSNGVMVPEEHMACGLVKPSVDEEGRSIDPQVITRGLFRVCCVQGHKQPPGAYVAVKYRGYWYYIDDHDQASKSTLTLMLQLGRLDFGNQKPAAPFLTLPIGR